MFGRIWWDRGRMRSRTLILIEFNIDCKGRGEEVNLAKKRRMRLRRIFCISVIDHFIELFQTECCRCRVSLLKRRSKFKWRSYLWLVGKVRFNTSFPLLAFSLMFPTFFFTKLGAYSQISIKSEDKTDQIRKINKRSSLSSELSEFFKKRCQG